jgi:outer membrane protein
VPFQEGLKYAYVILARVAAEANEGKAAADRVRKFNDDKAAELNNKNKALQAAQDRLEKGGTVMSDAARAQLQTDIDRQTRDLQRSQEDAQQDFQNFQQQVQLDFNNKLNPIVDKVAKAKGVHFVFSAQDAGLIWADPSLDLTNEVIKEFNTSTPAPAATAKPVAPAPATTAKPAAGTTK